MGASKRSRNIPSTRFRKKTLSAKAQVTKTSCQQQPRNAPTCRNKFVEGTVQHVTPIPSQGSPEGYCSLRLHPKPSGAVLQGPTRSLGSHGCEGIGPVRV